MKGGRNKETGAIVDRLGLFFGFYGLGLGGGGLGGGKGKGERDPMDESCRLSWWRKGRRGRGKMRRNLNGGCVWEEYREGDWG